MMLFWIFFKQELVASGKTPTRFLQNILFFLISCAVFFIMTQSQQQQASMLINIIWISLLFSILFSNAEFLRDDFRDGTLEQMIIFCENLEIYIFAKIFAAWIIFCLPILVTLPFLLSVMNFELVWGFVVLATLASLAINFIAAFCGSLNIAGNKAPLLAILTMPLIIPILLIAISAFDVDNFYSALKILSGICVFCVLISVVATTKIIKIVCE